MNRFPKSQEEAFSGCLLSKSINVNIEEFIKARFLALVRSKRGTRRWAAARSKLETRSSRSRKSSFWLQATKIVFPDPPDKKVLKIL